MSFLSGLFGGSKPPPAPDYTAIANQQAALNQQQAQTNLLANRPNVTGPYGGRTWGVGPDGRPTMTDAYNPALQGQMDQLTGMGGGLLSQAGGAMGQPIDFSGLTGVTPWQNQQIPGQGLNDWGQAPDFSKLGAMPEAGFGAVQQVQDAMMSRLNPALQAQRDAEMQRLAATGATEGSRGQQASMTRMGQQANDANQQALLGAMGAYGDIFNRGMAVRQQGLGEQMTAANYANALRGQQLGEQQLGFQDTLAQQNMQRQAQQQDYARQLQEMLTKRELPMQEFGQVQGAVRGMPQLNFGSYGQMGNVAAPDIQGAAQKTYEDQMAKWNADQASKGGLLKTIGGIAGSFFGPMGTAIGSSIGGALGPQGQAPAQNPFAGGGGFLGGLGTMAGNWLGGQVNNWMTPTPQMPDYGVYGFPG